MPVPIPSRLAMLNGQYIRISLYFADAPSPDWHRNYPLRRRIGDLICTIAKSSGALPVLGDCLWVEVDEQSMLTFRVERRTFSLPEDADTEDGIRPDLNAQYAVVPLLRPASQ